MTMSKEIITSNRNKSIIMCGLNESGYSDKNTVMEEVEGRIIPVPNDSDSFINEIMKHPDAHVLIDMLIGEKDAVSFIREAKRRLPQCRTVFIVKCEYVSFRMERELYGAGASAVIAKDWSPDTVLSLLREYFGVSGGASSVRDNAPGEPAVDPVELEIMVTDIMHKVGVPAHIKGYQYLRCAIVKAVMEPEIINAVTRELYPGVAACFLTTPSRVERAIRHAIEVAWDRGDIDFLSTYFGSTVRNSRGKPTNSEFIAIIADKLRMTLRTA